MCSCIVLKEEAEDCFKNSLTARKYAFAQIVGCTQKRPELLAGKESDHRRPYSMENAILL
jgi:hypothetical protein